MSQTGYRFAVAIAAAKRVATTGSIGLVAFTIVLAFPAPGPSRHVAVTAAKAAATSPSLQAVPQVDRQQHLFELINAERAKAGLGILTYDPELADVATKHCEDMRVSGFVAHVSPTTGGTEERLLAAGIITDLAAENVGKGYSPDEIHKSFMGSPGHRAAILHPEVTHAGIGVVLKEEFDRTVFLVTELFIRRIPPLGPDAKAIVLKELNGLREPGGSPALEEDPTLTRMADETAREFLDNQALSQDDVMGRLQRRIARTDLKTRKVTAVLSIAGSLRDGAKQAAADPKGVKSRRVGIGISQGARSGLVPNSIILVIIYIE